MSESRAIQRLLDGVTPSHVALMELLVETKSIERAELLLRGLHEHVPVAETLRLLAQERRGCERVVQMVRTLDTRHRPAVAEEEGLAFCRNLFDSAVLQSEEASVALYSLGSARLLEQSTAEVVRALRGLNVVGPDRDGLEIGCGIGRMQKALSGSLRSVAGVDLSERMIEAARRRCAGLTNVRLVHSDGRNLSAFKDESVDLVFAVDSIPYLVQTGLPLVERHFHETRRVLRAGGDFVFFAFSYRGSLEQDVAEVRALAHRTGLDPQLLGIDSFNLWAGEAYHLRKAGPRS